MRHSMKLDVIITRLHGIVLNSWLDVARNDENLENTRNRMQKFYKLINFHAYLCLCTCRYNSFVCEFDRIVSLLLDNI